MEKKYFTGLCVMDSANLRANILYHTCLVFFEGDCNKYGQLLRPLRVIDSYSFYSHPIPERPPVYAPSSFFAYSAGIPRTSGSYGEWRRENIHDLALGRGLTGLLLEMKPDQFNGILKKIRSDLLAQEHFFAGLSTIKAREVYYQSQLDIKTNEYIAAGVAPEAAAIAAKHALPVREFHPGYNCKVAVLEKIQESYGPIPPKKIISILDTLKGDGITSTMPRFIENLYDIIIHAETDAWQVRGNSSKYPYIEWEQANNDNSFSMYTVDFGKRYIDVNGNSRWIDNLSRSELQLIQDLKTIGRMCEINLHDPDYRKWNHEISWHIHKIATCVLRKDRAHYIGLATEYKQHLLDDMQFNDKIKSMSPAYLGNELRCMIMAAGTTNSIRTETA